MSKYNKDFFSDYFTLSAESPSGLIWVKPVYSGKNSSVVKNPVGTVAGFIRKINNSRYSVDEGFVSGWSVTVNGKMYEVHRIIMALKDGHIEDSLFVDHIDGNPLNNSEDNLRVVDRVYNNRNTGLNRNNKTGVKGVYKRSDRYIAEIRTLGGEKLSKSFSILKYGEDQSLELATNWRLFMIEELNAQGAGYTDRHVELTKIPESSQAKRREQLTEVMKNDQ